MFSVQRSFLRSLKKDNHSNQSYQRGRARRRLPHRFTLEGRTHRRGKKYWGQTPQEIQAGYDFLTLGQVYAALAYYYDHQAEIDDYMERVGQEVDAVRTANPNPMPRADWEKRFRERATK